MPELEPVFSPLCVLSLSLPYTRHRYVCDNYCRNATVLYSDFKMYYLTSTIGTILSSIKFVFPKLENHSDDINLGKIYLRILQLRLWMLTRLIRQSYNTVKWY